MLRDGCAWSFGSLIITDATVNIAPTLQDKIDIVQNAIDLAHAVGFPEARVAILSATETVNPKILSAIEAAALQGGRPRSDHRGVAGLPAGAGQCNQPGGCLDQAYCLAGRGQGQRSGGA